MTRSPFKRAAAAGAVLAATAMIPFTGVTAHAAANDAVLTADSNSTLGVPSTWRLTGRAGSYDVDGSAHLNAAANLDLLANDNLAGVDLNAVEVEFRKPYGASTTAFSVDWDPLTDSTLVHDIYGKDGDRHTVVFDYRLVDGASASPWTPVTLDVEITHGDYGTNPPTVRCMDGRPASGRPNERGECISKFHRKIRAGERAVLRLDYSEGAARGRTVMLSGSAGPWKPRWTSHVDYRFDLDTSILTMVAPAGAGWVDETNGKRVANVPTPSQCETTSGLFVSAETPSGILFTDSHTHGFSGKELGVMSEFLCDSKPPKIAPDARDDSTEVRRGERRVVNVLKNDKVNGKKATVKVVKSSLPKGVSAKVDGKNRVVLTVNRKTTEVLFRYRLTNEHGLSDTAIVVAHVMPDITTGADHDVPKTDASVATQNAGPGALGVALGGLGAAMLVAGGALALRRRETA